MRTRAALGLAVLAAVALAAGGNVASVPSKQKPAQLCQAALRALAQLPPPASVDDAAGHMTALIHWDAAEVEAVSTKSDWLHATENQLIGSDLFLDPTNVSATSLAQALATHDGPLAAQLLNKAQTIYAAIDRAQKHDKLPAACSSPAFGAAYLAQVAALVRSGLALTGDFTTDANAACARVNKKRVSAAQDLDLTDQTSLEGYVGDVGQAFHAFQVDLQAIAPPPGPPVAYSNLRSIVDQAVQKIDQANATLTTGAGKRQLQTLGEQISALGPPLTAAASALGLTC